MKILIMLFALLTVMVTTAQAQFIVGSEAVDLSFSSRVNMAKGVDIASRATVDLNSVAGNLVHVTGASTITSFGTASQAGIQRHVIFDGINTLTHNASVLVIPGNSNVVTAAGDSALVVADTTAKWIVLQYTRKATAP